MSRTLSLLLGLALMLLVAPFAYASGSKSHHYSSDYNYDYRYLDNSINDSFNNYDSFNKYGWHYTYGYPYSNQAYDDRYYDYSGYHYYNDGYAYSYKPNCSITVSGASGTYGHDRTITLAWSSSYATSAYLSGVGSVGTHGAHAVYYPYNSSYTLTVHGPGGTASCSTNNPYYSTQFYYDRPYAYGHASNVSYAYPNTYSTYTYPSAGYIYPTAIQLNQMPYTGFDFGVVGNSLYWLGMILIAGMLAYLIVYSHSGALPRAFAMEVVAAARNQLRLVRSIIR